MKEPGAKAAILVVDDQPEAIEIVRRNLEPRGYRIEAAPGVPEALEILARGPVDLVITDLKMPRVSGIDLVRHVRENLAGTVVMMITGYATIGGAVEAVKAGAEEYLSKPFTEEELIAAVTRALERGRLRRGSEKTPPHPPNPPGLLGQSAPMGHVYRAVGKAAGTSATVLITGESGTGKELVARAIHYSGPRAPAPFVPVSCGAIPEGLIESELFGHLKGAFTSATESRAGFFLTADGGTIFLDEIAELSAATQVKLLRVLQDHEVYMVGADRPRKVDVRVIAATNKPLATLVEKGAFREDLYFRLNVLVIDLPPLRDRGEDVLLLMDHFAVKFARELGKPAPTFDEAARRAFLDYHWPGNVRELENVVQRLIVMVDGPAIDLPDLPVHMRFAAPRGASFDRTLAQVEADYVRGVLASVGGNKSRAAEILGIDRKTLREKLRPAARS